jgi:Zn-dependent protease
MKCQKCQKEVFLPFKCPYCGDYFCSEHRLPENHECPQMEQARMPKEETQPITVQKQEPYQYTITYASAKQAKRMGHFSTKEIEHLAIGAILVAGVGLSYAITVLFNDYAMLTLLTSILTASFFTHEIAHKIIAQKKGLWAEFRLTLIGAALTLISALPTIFKIISPGAVMIAGSADKETIGKISIAGPITNIAFSTVFLAVAFALPQNTAIAFTFAVGAAFNAWIAVFNLIPFGILDGFKVFLWNKEVWVLAFAASLVLTVISYTLIL